MTDKQALVKTLDFQLDIQSDNESLLYDACLEVRSVYNDTIRLAKDGVDWDAIPERCVDRYEPAFEECQDYRNPTYATTLAECSAAKI